MKHIDVAVGIIINSQHQVLVAQRSMKVELGGYWEFPGGKVEAGESVYNALCRELNEEINIDVTAAEPFLQIDHQYSRFHASLYAFIVKQFTGELVARESQPLKWMPITVLDPKIFPPANAAIIEKLQDYSG